jgi:hypothetical protein
MTAVTTSSGTIRAYQLPTTGPWAVPRPEQKHHQVHHKGDTQIDRENDETEKSVEADINDNNGSNKNNCINLPPIHEYYYDASGIYEQLDSLAIPQVTSAFDPMPLSRDLVALTSSPLSAGTSSSSSTIPSMTEWWRSIRNELIFRRFHEGIEREHVRRRPGQENKFDDNSMSRRKGTKRPRRGSRDVVVVNDDKASETGGPVMAPTKRPPDRSKRDDSNKYFQNSGRSRTIEDNGHISFPTSDEYLAIARTSSSDFRASLSGGADVSLQKTFAEWRFILGSHCSLLLYGGGGSKRLFLNQFASEELSKDGDVITVNGFDPRATIEGILQMFIDHWFDGNDPSGSSSISSSSLPLCYRSDSSFGTNDPNVDPTIIDKAIIVARNVSRIVSQESLRPVYLVLHNIDGIGLRNKTAQRALAVLIDESRVILDSEQSGLHAIRLVTSIDHINAPVLLWDTFTRHRFQLVWKEVPTSFTTRYEEELVYDDGIIRDLSLKSSASRRQSSGGNSGRISSSAGQYGMETEESIFGVLTSLASRHAQVLQQLAELQLKSIQQHRSSQRQDQASGEQRSHKRSKKDREEEGNRSWVAYTDLLRQCRHQFIVANDSQLRSYIGELLDHSIVEKRASSSSTSGSRGNGKSNSGSAIGSSSYRIPYPINILDMILDYDPTNDDPSSKS